MAQKGIHVAASGLDSILKRNRFYFENYRALCLIFYLLLLLVLLLTGFIFYERVVFPKPLYFATTPDGKPIPVIRLDAPLYSDASSVLNWASQAVLAIYSMDYVTWRYTLQNLDVYFTPDGYQDFLVALKVSTNLAAIKANRQVVSAAITGTPTLMRSGQLTPDMPYSWDITLPVNITYQNSENNILVQKGNIFMRVDRASLLRYKEGLAISQLVLQTQ